jgi:hypothetical protein
MADAQKVRILFLSASPSDTTRLAVEQEQHEILARLRAVAGSDRFDLVFEPEVRADELAQVLQQHRPDLVHFSGHGTADGALLLADASDHARSAAPEDVARVFSLLAADVPVRAVVLSACYSEGLAVALTASVDCVIGCSAQLRDSVAVAFAGAFYQAIAFGRDLETAFGLAVTEVRLTVAGPSDLPVMRAREGFVASSLRFVDPAPAPETSAAPDPVPAAAPPVRSVFTRVDLGLAALAPRAYNKPQLLAVHGNATEVWVVGSLGAKLHFDGSAWTDVRLASGNALFAVWSSGPGAAWAVSYEGVLREQHGWKALPRSPTTCGAIGGTGPADVWFVGDDGLVLHWNGAALATVKVPATESLHAVWAGGSGDVWIAGDRGCLLHHDGRTWTCPSLPPETAGERTFHAVWGTGPADVWLSAHDLEQGGELFRHDGAAWRAVDTPETAPFVSFCGSGPGDVWAATSSDVWHFDGSTWRHVHNEPVTRLFALYSRGPAEVWLVGDDGLVLRATAP